MAILVHDHDSVGSIVEMPVATTKRILLSSSTTVLPSGSLRIGGDAPYGLVLVSGVPAARKVRVYDRETGVLVLETMSDIDGTYPATGLPARTEGYDVQIMGNTGERDVIVARVQPG
jgi:hypothetical protein